jgi:hypothetical protein
MYGNFASMYALDSRVEYLIIIAENNKGKTRSSWQGADTLSQHSDRLLPRLVTIARGGTDNFVYPLYFPGVHSARRAHAHECINILREHVSEEVHDRGLMCAPGLDRGLEGHRSRHAARSLRLRCWGQFLLRSGIEHREGSRPSP